MQFLREDRGKAVEAVVSRICKELENAKRVLWLVSGGSNVSAEVEIMSQVRERYTDNLTQLAVLPMDERYGEHGHGSSNTQLLQEAGFDPGAATWVDILVHNTPFDQTIDFYNDVASTALSSADVVIAQFGMGDNGHVAGVQPDSPAATADETTVAGFTWSDYTRLTLTPMALKRVDAAYLLAYGASKQEALQRLRDRAETLSELPAMLLYEIPEVYIYNDQIESEATV